MKNRALLICLFIFALLGCHKKETAATPPPPEAAQTATADVAPPASEPGPAPVQPQGAPPPAPAPPAKLPPPPTYVTANADNNLRQSVVGQVDPSLTAALRTFVNKKGRMPGSFFEFTANALDSLPRPPEGKHWVIDASDTSVKAVANK